MKKLLDKAFNFLEIHYKNKEFNDYATIELNKERIGIGPYVCFLSAFLYTVFGVVDYFSTTPDNLLNFFFMRIFVASILMSCGFLSIYNKDLYIKKYMLIITSIFLLSALSIATMVWMVGPDDIAKHTYFAGIMLVISIISTFGHTSLKGFMVWGVFLALSYMFVRYMSNTTESSKDLVSVIFNNTLFILSSILIAVMVMISKHRALYDKYTIKIRLSKLLIEQDNPLFNVSTLNSFNMFKNAVEDQFKDAFSCNLTLNAFTIKYKGNLEINEELLSTLKEIIPSSSLALFHEGNIVLSILSESNETVFNDKLINQINMKVNNNFDYVCEGGVKTYVPGYRDTDINFDLFFNKFFSDLMDSSNKIELKKSEQAPAHLKSVN